MYHVVEELAQRTLVHLLELGQSPVRVIVTGVPELVWMFLLSAVGGRRRYVTKTINT